MLTGANHYGTTLSEFVTCFVSEHGTGDFTVLLSTRVRSEMAFIGRVVIGNTARNDHQDLEDPSGAPSRLHRRKV